MLEAASPSGGRQADLPRFDFSKHRLYGTMSSLRFTIPALLISVFALGISPLTLHSQESSKKAESSTAEVAHADEVAKAADSHEAGEHSGEHGAGEHHDSDPTHANVSDATYQVIDWRTDMAFFSAVVFGLLLVVLGTTAWKPINWQ